MAIYAGRMKPSGRDWTRRNIRRLWKPCVSAAWWDERSDLNMSATVIDRIAPTRRPDGPVAGYQRWRSLLFLHWPVPVDRLRPLVPAELTLDLYGDVAYVGVVPFAMEGVRPRWWPEFLALRFL